MRPFPKEQSEKGEEKSIHSSHIMIIKKFSGSLAMLNPT